MTELTVRQTAIPGLLVLDLPVHGDARGWFKENWQRAKMIAVGLPDFGPVQHNIAFNTNTGVARGLHAEPWDKLLSVVTGRVFGAWVDLRASDTFGAVVTEELGPQTAVFVPRGVANGYQTLEPGTAYSYLVNEHWSQEAKSSYTFVNLADPQLAISWPIPLDQSEISAADQDHPLLTDVVPMPAKRTVIIGANGQLGRALAQLLPDAIALKRPNFDLTRPEDLAQVLWSQVGTIINASGFTAVDAAETVEGRRDAWAINAEGVARLARVATDHQATLVHVSSDYVFDGTREWHTEDEPFAPLGVYGQTKAAADAVVAMVPRHYIVRTSWMIGEGKNFVATMAALATRNVTPSVVNDQFGRLTFTDDLARAICHLVGSGAPFGVYNVTGDGPVQSWAEIAADVFQACGHDRSAVVPISTDEYGQGKQLSPRPVHSTLALAKIKATGFRPAPVAESLAAYLAARPAGS